MNIPAYENPVDQESVHRAVHDPISLLPWQRYLLSRFPREEYVPVPDYARFMSSMWRHATWEHFISDTVKCNGTQMASILSMAYKPKIVVEMGIDAGLTTLQFCKLNPEATVYGVDLNSKKHDADLPICSHAMMNKVRNLTLVLGRPSWEFEAKNVDLCFIDGDHMGESPYKDSKRAWANRNANGNWCIAWDDYHDNNPDVVCGVNRFISEVGMKMNQVGSWFYIGTIPHEELRKHGCST